MKTCHLVVCLFVCVATLLTFPASASAQTDWTFCAWEGATCSFSGTKEVRYGANGSYYYRTLSNGTPCTNSVFGDPLVGATKSCAIRNTSTTSTTTTSWTFCAWEGATCSFSGTKEVRYGANGSYVYKTLSNGTACTNSVFGDPLVGATKSCAISNTSTTSTTTTSWNFCAWEGATCSFSGTKEVRYGANGSYVYKTLSNGTPCTNSVFGDPLVGATKSCYTGASSTSSTSTTTAPTSTSSYGPRSTITCPAGSVDILPGTSIPYATSLHQAGTTYCLRAGVHYLTGSITPETRDTFVGEYGAILDGSRWTTSDGTQAAFRAHNENIDYVTIRNLVIRNMPQRGIHAYYLMSDHWTIEYNEIASSRNTGIVFPSYATIRNNYIHHNTYAGYLASHADNTTFDSNEIAYNGDQQKVGVSANVTFRNNFVHHNAGAGIWYDTDNTGGLIEGNRVEDNGWLGINYEVSSDGIIRNNTIRRNLAGVNLSVSKNVQIYNNTLEYNSRGIAYFLRCESLGGPTNYDLANNTAHDNVIVVGPESGALANYFSYLSTCTSTQVAPYLNGSKSLTFSRNTYRVPSVNGRYWIWGTAFKLWNEWQSLGQDLDGSVSQ